MTVLITGGLGFIGSELANQLRNAGRDVIVCNPSGNTTLLERYGIGDDVTILAGNVTETATVFRTVRERGVTHVVHLAALLPNAAVRDPRKAADVNVMGTNTVLEAARLFPEQLERVALASSETVYAPDAAYQSQPDDSSLLFPGTIYSAAKQYNERQAEVYANQYGVDVVSLRLTGAYGPYRDSDEGCPSLFEGGAYGNAVTVADSGERRSWLYVSDAAQAFRKAAFVPESALSRNVYNVRGEMGTVSDVVAAVRRLVPDLDVTVEEVNSELSSAQNLDISASRADLGYEIKYDLDAFVREYVNTLRADEGLSPIENETDS